MKNKIFKTFTIIIIVILGLSIICGSAFGIYYASVNKNTLTIHFDESKTYQIFSGFGASTAWTYDMMGTLASEEAQDEVVKLLYSNDGLKLNIFRFYVGAGSWEIEDCFYGDHAKTISFFKSENYVNGESFSNLDNYDFNKNKGYINMFIKALKTNNIKKLVLFANSPHYLLTKNNKTNGTYEKENNLLEENFGYFSDYMLSHAILFDSLLKSLGYKDIEIYISPVNEPQWKWGGDGASQEGCHFDPEPLAKFYDVFYKKMIKINEENNTNFKLDIYESGNYSLGLSSAKNEKYFKNFAKYDYFNEIEEISMHSYKACESKSMRRKFMNWINKNYSNKKVVMSEYCVMEWGVDESIAMGLKSTRCLINDLNIMNVSEWSWWQSVAGGGYEDGLIYWDKETQTISKTYRYYMYAQFMKYIDKGDVRIKADINDSLDLGGVISVAFKKPDGSIVLIVMNDNNSTKTLKLSQGDFKSMKTIMTAENIYLKETDYISFKNSFEVLPNSVTTIILK